MNKHSMIFIGLDTHKEFHEVAYCEEQRGASPVHYGRIPSSKVSVKKLLRQFESKYPGATLHVWALWLLDLSADNKFRALLLCRGSVSYSQKAWRTN